MLDEVSQLLLFFVTNGVKKDNLISPMLVFNVYMDNSCIKLN